MSLPAPKPIQPSDAESLVSPGPEVAGGQAISAPTNNIGVEFQRAQQELYARGFVQFHPALANLVGGYKPALMLGHALYWTRTWLSKHPERDGWFWKIAVEWRDAVGLSQREQETARASLREANVWEEQVAGSPARLYYRVDLAALTEALIASAPEPSQPEDADAPNAAWRLLIALMGRPVLYFKPLADIAGGSAAGLVLSNLLAECREAVNTGGIDVRGFFETAVEESRIALGLGTKAQRNARDALRRAGLIQEAWTQEQRPRLMVRLNLAALMALLTGQGPTKLRRRGKPKGAPGGMEAVPVQGRLLVGASDAVFDLPNRAVVVGRDGNVTQVLRLMFPDSGTATSRKARAKVQHGPDQGASRHGQDRTPHAQQQLTDAKGCPFVETDPLRVALFANQGLPFSRTSIQKELIQRTTPTRAHEAPAVDNSVSRRSRAGEDGFEERSEASTVPSGLAPDDAAAEEGQSPELKLIIPTALDASLHEHARRVVAAAPSELRQALLDELAGSLQIPTKRIANPVGWLHALVQKATDGTLVLTLSDGVAKARSARAEHEARLASAIGAAQQPAKASREVSVPAQPSAQVLAERSRLKALAAELRRSVLEVGK